MGSLIDPSFGRAPFFLIIETETMAVEVVENTAAEAGHGAGIAAKRR